MTPDFFVDALKQRCRDGAVEDCVALFKNPPGRRPREELKRISHWFNALSPADRELVIAAMWEASDTVLFGELCVIDGVRVIESEEEKSEFKLTATRCGIESQLSHDTFLHNLLRAKPSQCAHMDSLEPELEPGEAFVNGSPVNGMRGVRLDTRTFEIHLHGRECIRLYTFNSSMLPIQSKRIGVDKYIFNGPQLGLYHDTADIREDPYINHFISQLEIFITYCSSDEAFFRIKGTADLSRSSLDPYWYKGATSGDWAFEVSFTHRFAQA
jgi:hypothetical protein